VSLRVLFLLLFLVAGCRHKATGTSSDPQPITVRDESSGLLLTWIDEKGDFHVETQVKDVPLKGRDAVRVVDPNLDEGTHDGKIFIADLRSKNPDGSYPVHVSTRADFDQLAVDRRKKTGPTLADQPTDAGKAGPGNDLGAANMQAVIIYGAPWCGPCHEAAAYLRKKGIPFVEKDVDDDRSAQTEMQGKLRRAGLPAGSIPVIDVRGKILVGFDPRAIDEALGRAT